jgi:hypothetical protein
MPNVQHSLAVASAWSGQQTDSLLAMCVKAEGCIPSGAFVNTSNAISKKQLVRSGINLMEAKEAPLSYGVQKYTRCCEAGEASCKRTALCARSLLLSA